MDIAPVTPSPSLSVESTVKCVVESKLISGDGQLDSLDTIVDLTQWIGPTSVMGAVMHGSPRQHIWSFVAGVAENYPGGLHVSNLQYHHMYVLEEVEYFHHCCSFDVYDFVVSQNSFQTPVYLLHMSFFVFTSNSGLGSATQCVTC